jgi:glycosyltransferase involved in cell wall biosynthesis
MSQTPSTNSGSPRDGAAPPEPAPAAQRIRIAWIASAGAIERLSCVLQPLAIGLIDELVELTVICPEAGEVRDLPCPPVEVIRFRELNWPLLRHRRLEELVAELAPRKVDLLHALDAAASDMARRLARRMLLPYAVTCDGLDDARALGELDDRAAALAMSVPVQRELQVHSVAPSEDIHLVRPGVYQARRANCFNALGRSAAIIAGGTLEDLPAFQTVLRGLCELRRRQGDCVFFVLGGGGRAESPIRALSEKLGLRGDLTFVDPQTVSQLPQLLKAADIYVAAAPSRRYDLNALLAMASGVPVVATANPSVDFLIPGRTASLFRAGDPADLADKLDAFLHDHAAARAQAESALGYLRDNHSPARTVAWMSDLYRRTIGAPSPAR